MPCRGTQLLLWRLSLMSALMTLQRRMWCRLRTLSSVCSVTFAAIDDYGDDVGVLSPDLIRVACRADETYHMLIKAVEDGFPPTCHQTAPKIRENWEVRDRLSTEKDLVLLDRRILIPILCCKRVLRCLHSAHQGVTGMRARANVSVYWPGMDAAIQNFHAGCVTCHEISPSQPPDPLILTPSPQWPFQQICMDMFDSEQHMYLACADGFTGWLVIFHFKPGTATSSKLISVCRTIFQAYGAPEESNTDGGSIFTSKEFQGFLRSWCVHHPLSRVAYAQSNGRAEVRAGVNSFFSIQFQFQFLYVQFQFQFQFLWDEK